METEAKVIINGGFAFLYARRVLHVENKEYAEENAISKILESPYQYAYGYRLIPVGQQYENIDKFINFI